MKGMRLVFAFSFSSRATSSARSSSSVDAAISASSASISSLLGRLSAMRRASASFTVRLTEMLAGEPDVV